LRELESPSLQAVRASNDSVVCVVVSAAVANCPSVPDFRSSNGLFTTLRSEHKLKASGKHLFDASVYKSGSSTSSFHDMVRSLSQLINSTRPTAFHHLLATLARDGRLMRLYSQNVDGIDTSLPPLATKVPLSTKGPWPRTIQLHGGLEKMVCQKCNHLSTFQPALFEGPEPPSCGECEALDSVRTTIAGKRSHGIGKLRPRIVLYNEYNPDAEAIGAVTKADLRSRPDAVIVVGTSLKVPGVRRIVREMCGVVRARRDGVAIWINNDPEPLGKEFENCWDLVVRGDCEEVARHANLKRWDDEDDDNKEFDGVKNDCGGVKVVIQKKKKGVESAQGVLTPIGSPPLKTSSIKQGDTSRAKHLNAEVKQISTKSRPRKTPKNAEPSLKKKRSKAPASEGVMKINATFKVSKAIAIASKPPKSTGQLKEPAKPPKPEVQVPLSQVPREIADTPSLSPTLTIRPHSPRALRPNTFEHVQIEEKESSIVIAQPRLQLSICSPVHHTPGGFAGRSETVSPKGPLPDSLAKLMNL
jgi:NAD+-dependent protein deacetylase SIR2